MFTAVSFLVTFIPAQAFFSFKLISFLPAVTDTLLSSFLLTLSFLQNLNDQG